MNNLNKKINRMQLILIIASLFIMFANISLFTSGIIESDIINIIVGFIISTLLLGISYEVEKELKLDKSSKLITLMAMVSFFVTFVGTYFNIIKNFDTKDGFLLIKSINLNIYTAVALIGVIIPIVGYFLNKDSIYKKIIVISSLYLFYFIFNSIYTSCNFDIVGISSNSGILEFITLSLIVLLYNLFLSNEYSKTLSITNFLYTIYVLINVPMDIEHVVADIAVSTICIISFLIRIRKEESKKYDTVPFIGIVFFLIALFSGFCDDLLILPLGFVIVTDMLIIVADVVKDRKEGLIYKVVLDLLTIAILINSINTSYHIIPMVLIVLITSLISTYALKSDYHEQYILPFKMVVCIVGLLIEIKQHISLDPIIIVLIVNVFAILSSYLQKNVTFKRLFTIIAMFTFVYTVGVETIFEFIVLLSMIVFDYIILFEADKRSTEFKNIFVIFSIILILVNLEIFHNPLLYLLSALVFILAHITIKEKVLNIVTFIAFIIASVTYVNSCGISYEASDVLSYLLIFGGSFYLTYKIDALNNILFRTIILWGLTLALFSLSTLVSLLVALVLNVIVLLIFMKENNAMFKSGVILTIIGIFTLLNELDQVPTFVYMLLVGLTVVFIIFKSIKKYISEPHEEEEKTKEFVKTGKKFCTNCGYELSPDSKFCPRCGNKIDK